MSVEPSAVAVNRFGFWRLLSLWGSIAVVLGMVVVFSALEPHLFLTWSNLVNILSQSALTSIIAVGLTFPLAAGEFDLSVGYVASLGGIITGALMVDHHWSIAPAVVLAVAISATIGFINGLLVTVVGINAMVATLGVGTMVLGANYAIGHGIPVAVENETFINFTINRFFGVPYPVYVMAGVGLLSWILLNKTTLGYAMQAVGGNPTASEFAGIRVGRVRRQCFVIAAVCAALTGILLASQSGSATFDGGQAYLLSAYAAAFFGSAVLRDGQFHVVGTLIGVLTVAIGFDGIALIGIAVYYQYLFQGGLLIFAVGVGTLARRAVQR